MGRDAQWRRLTMPAPAREPRQARPVPLNRRQDIMPIGPHRDQEQDDRAEQPLQEYRSIGAARDRPHTTAVIAPSTRSSATRNAIIAAPSSVHDRAGIVLDDLGRKLPQCPCGVRINPLPDHHPLGAGFVLRTDAGLHADGARRHIGETGLKLAARPSGAARLRHDHRAQRRGTSSYRYQCRLRQSHSVLSQPWRAPCLGAPGQLIAGGAGARPDHPITGP